MNKMEGIAEGTNDEVKAKDTVPLRNDERENFVARATTILNAEDDDLVLESVVELLEDLKINNAVREGLKSFQKNGWAVIRKTLKRNTNDFKLQDNPTSSSMMVKKLELVEQQQKGNLASRLDRENPLINPLKNELILKKIFELSSVSELKTCRLVSKNWHDRSLFSWRRKAVLRTMRLFPFLYGDEDNDEEATAKSGFINNASKVLESKLQRYDMNFHDIEGCFLKDFEIKKRKLMLEVFSSSIQELFIKCDDLDIVCFLLTKLPELRVLHLELDCVALYPEYQSIISKDQECPLRDLKSALTKLWKLELNITHRSVNFEMNVNFPWKKIFECVPALKSFNLVFRVGNTVSDEIMQAVCDIRRETIFSILNLEELRIRPGSSARFTVGSKLPLQTLSIEMVDDDNTDPSTISDLLEAHAGTLQNLNGYMRMKFGQLHQPSLPLASYFPSKVTLPNLKELTLGNDWVWAFHILSSLDAPHLETLRISSSERSVQTEQRNVVEHILKSDEFMGSCYFPNLKEFFCNAPLVFRLTELQMLGKSMPKLKDVWIRLGEDTFPILYELWPSLESLHICATGVTYQLIDDCSIAGFLAEGFDDPVQVRSESCGPNITDLKNLRKFVLETYSDGTRNLPLLRPRRACISDISAVYGFLQLPKLEILDMQTIYKFTPGIMVAMEDHISNLKFREPYGLKAGDLLENYLW